MEKMKQWTMLTALGVVGIMAAGWFLLVSPQKAHAKDLQTQATAQQSSTAQLQQQVDQLKQQQKNEPAQQALLNKIATQVPDNPELPVLIRQLSSAAHDAGVSLVSMAPSQPTTVAAAAAAAPAAPVAGASSAAAPAALAQIPLTIQVSGSYFNIESFFRSVEHLDRAMLVTGFTLDPDANAGSTSNTTTGATSGGSGSVAAAPDALTAQITAVVFESPSVAPAAGVAAAPTTTAPVTTTTTAPAPQASAVPSAAPAQ
jgi:Tfp pilus assembly protein PilO